MKPLLAEHVVQHFQHVHLQHALAYPDFAQFLEQHLFFMTARFNPKSISLTGKHPLSEFGKLTFEINKRLLGNNLKRKRLYQPLTYAFVDFEGTRASSAAIDPYRSTGPHIHALSLIRPQHLKHFTAIRPDLVLLKPGSINDLKVEPFDSERGSAVALAGYCMKAFARAPASFHGRNDLWALYPR